MGPMILVVSCCFPKVEYIYVSGVEAVDFGEVEAMHLPRVEALEMMLEGKLQSSDMVIGCSYMCKELGRKEKPVYD
jgi:hypothetical protein